MKVWDNNEMKMMPFTKKQINQQSLLSMMVNIGLFVGKLIAGLWINSIALLSDAVNHLADSFSALVYWGGQRLSYRAPDDNHPQGHGRGEYLTALTIAAIMLVISGQFFVESINRMLNPTFLVIPPWVLWLTVVAMLCKLTIYFYFKWINQRQPMLSIKALAIDNLLDVFTNFIVLVSFLLQPILNLPLDGYAGLLIASLIAFHGGKILLESVRQVLGKTLNEQDKAQAMAILKQYPKVQGAHGFMLHDYGPSYQMLNFHLEVSEDLGLVEAHNLVDEVEEKLEIGLGVKVMIHLDPMMMNQANVAKISQTLLNCLKTEHLDQGIVSIRPIQESHHPEIVIGINRRDNIIPIKKILLAAFPHYRFVFELEATQSNHSLIK